MKICYTLSDAIQAMVREEVCWKVETWEDGCSEEVWEKVKTTFARKHRTKKDYVHITAVRQVPDDYRPIKF